MRTPDWMTPEKLWIIVITGLMAFLLGFIKYLEKTDNLADFKVYPLIRQSIISAAVGLSFGFLCAYLSLDPFLSGFLGSVVGYYGTHALILAGKYLEKKIDIKIDKSDNKDE